MRELLTHLATIELASLRINNIVIKLSFYIEWEKNQEKSLEVLIQFKQFLAHISKLKTLDVITIESISDLNYTRRKRVRSHTNEPTDKDISIFLDNLEFAAKKLSEIDNVKITQKKLADIYINEKNDKVSQVALNRRINRNEKIIKKLFKLNSSKWLTLREHLQPFNTYNKTKL